MRHCLLLLLLAGCQKIADFDPPPERGGQCQDGIDNDGDGDSDCADSDCADSCGFLGCGNGKIDPPAFTFAAGASVSVPGGPVAVLPARVNGDDQTDLYVATGNGVRELRNSGGILTAQTPVDTSTIGPVIGLAVGRFDAGGSDDAALLIGGAAHQVVPILNDAGTLRAGRVAGVQDSPVVMVAGAFDGKAGDDILVGALESSPYLANDGAAVFTTSFPQVPSPPRGLAVGDQDGDGDRDVFVAGTSAAYLLTNVGGTAAAFPFRAEKTVEIAGGAVAFLDADGANHLDVVVLEPRDLRARILLDAGAGVFTLGAMLPLGGTPVSVAAGDLDLDGIDDVAVGLSGGSIILFVGDGKGAFRNALTLSATSAEGLALADLDGKRGLEVVVAERSQNRVTVFPNTSRHEACDDGNTMSGDSCNADCTLP